MEKVARALNHIEEAEAELLRTGAGSVEHIVIMDVVRDLIEAGTRLGRLIEAMKADKL